MRSLMRLVCSLDVASHCVILINARNKCFMLNAGGGSHGSANETICFVGTCNFLVNIFSTMISQSWRGRGRGGWYNGVRIHGF